MSDDRRQLDEASVHAEMNRLRELAEKAIPEKQPFFFNLEQSDSITKEAAVRLVEHQLAQRIAQYPKGSVCSEEVERIKQQLREGTKS